MIEQIKVRPVKLSKTINKVNRLKLESDIGILQIILTGIAFVVLLLFMPW